MSAARGTVGHGAGHDLDGEVRQRARLLRWLPWLLLVVAVLSSLVLGFVLGLARPRPQRAR